MQRRPSSLTILILSLTLFNTLCTNGLALEKDSTLPDDPGLMMSTDLVLARPVGAAATVTGFALFLVSSPFSLLGGNAGEAWDNLVVAPASYTFHRPLGNFDKPDPNEQPQPPMEAR
ncbi:hypothetical protein JWJ90_13725 [Desulfobulbus rhabdoformis]|jgi:hypothetical protein|uniref:hypothetical protein n=1 Tax=Desulfobulbus rhabdoformis TaxID=34032 RepID=UPI001962D610|nr:hypothetical protein [Desulfobulbus rhabdoformis]MBM9615338.1 hypothetical protein [Desulfobulbus rhabdoformis]